MADTARIEMRSSLKFFIFFKFYLFDLFLAEKFIYRAQSYEYILEKTSF